MLKLLRFCWNTQPSAQRQQLPTHPDETSQSTLKATHNKPHIMILLCQGAGGWWAGSYLVTRPAKNGLGGVNRHYVRLITSAVGDFASFD